MHVSVLSREHTCTTTQLHTIVTISAMGIPFEMRVSGYWKHSPDRCATPRCHLCAKSVKENQRRTSGDPAPSIYETLYRRVNPKFVVCFCSCVLVFWAAKRWTTAYGASWQSVKNIDVEAM